MIMQKLIYYSGVGDVAKKALQEAKKKLCHSQTSLGQGYSHFILGLEHWRSHHSKGGRYILSFQIPAIEFSAIMLADLEHPTHMRIKCFMKSVFIIVIIGSWCIVVIIQTLYEFVMLCVWICFGYKNWHVIQSEIGE